ncbi:MAG: porin [Hydrogenophaga sp.]|uniref:porin n=1 Tax=Hydrogenophaga sp. TaxID=1904254 RepID=UPI003D9AE87A
MKKSLIALAALGAMSAASAQSSLNLYGIADVVIHKDKGVAAKMTSGGVSSSRIGFKGTEDLGGGLKANFLLEKGVDLTSGAAAGFDRQSYVGLSNQFGEVRLGGVYTAYDDVAAATSPVFDSVLSPTKFLPTLNDYNYKPDGNIYYASPDFGGFSGAASTSLKQKPGNKATAFHVKYEGGPVYVSLGYQRDSASGSSTTFTRLNGSYDLGVAKILAGYGVEKDVSKDLTLGVDVPLSANLTLSAGYARAKLDAGGTATGFGLAAAYSLSKRTTVYGGLRNDNVDAVTLGGVDSRVGFGLKHTF